MYQKNSLPISAIEKYSAIGRVVAGHHDVEIVHLLGARYHGHAVALRAWVMLQTPSLQTQKRLESSITPVDLAPKFHPFASSLLAVG